MNGVIAYRAVRVRVGRVIGNAEVGAKRERSRRCVRFSQPTPASRFAGRSIYKPYGARELWKFCRSGGSGSHLLFVVRTLELWAAEADQVDWWEEAERRRRRR
jgi:hypothetical protein